MAPWDGEAGNSFWKGVGIIGVLLTAGIWTICVKIEDIPSRDVSGMDGDSS